MFRRRARGSVGGSNGRQAIVSNDTDRERFLAVLAWAVEYKISPWRSERRWWRRIRRVPSVPRPLARRPSACTGSVWKRGLRRRRRQWAGALPLARSSWRGGGRGGGG